MLCDVREMAGAALRALQREEQSAGKLVDIESTLVK
jgi:hypothetical protein